VAQFPFIESYSLFHLTPVPKSFRESGGEEFEHVKMGDKWLAKLSHQSWQMK
jgi:hypothetical protein